MILISSITGMFFLKQIPKLPRQLLMSAKMAVQTGRHHYYADWQASQTKTFGIFNDEFLRGTRHRPGERHE